MSLCEGPVDRVGAKLERRLSAFPGKLSDVRVASLPAPEGAKVRLSFRASAADLEGWLSSTAAPAIFYEEVRVSALEDQRFLVEMTGEVPCD
ncbi:hypothetical protein DDF67_12665 [Caulobacter endophyticus]|uniref:Uncharacterized protein n=2 Tax=Caulobacter endophyticus TaxID=2172652 RepID=A0A2T9JYM8_9CAUL|nr:hypothetical protein DDF67_12665 [Caulobacter endophyticus]